MQRDRTGDSEAGVDVIVWGPSIHVWGPSSSQLAVAHVMEPQCRSSIGKRMEGDWWQLHVDIRAILAIQATYSCLAILGCPQWMLLPPSYKHPLTPLGLSIRNQARHPEATCAANSHEPTSKAILHTLSARDPLRPMPTPYSSPARFCFCFCQSCIPLPITPRTPRVTVHAAS